MCLSIYIRVRDLPRNQEVPLATYQQLQRPRAADGGLFRKVLLGFVQTATENERVCAAFLRELVERGLKVDHGLLCVIDGAMGLRKAIQTVFGTQAVAQRTDKVTRWRTSDQKHRWLAAALLDIEPRLRRIKGYRAVPLLRAALHVDIRTKEITVGDQAA